ncbi:MAG: M3 family oligoendopeptidase [Thermodesulfobacteriota bacterium]
MFDGFPQDARATLDWSWDRFEPYYAELAKRPLTTDNVETFLANWTRVAELVDETHSRLYVATTQNTADKEAETRFHRYLDEIFPHAEQAEQQLKTKLLEQQHVPYGFDISLRKMRTQAELFREENLPLLTDEEKLCNEYDKTIGGQTVEWEGKEVTIPQLRPVFQQLDRGMREKAWRLALQRQLQDWESIGDLWKDFLGLRGRIAANANFSDYRSFRWKDMLRFDYTPDDCKAFHQAIQEAIVPVAERICERRRRQMGLESLRPWDMDVDPLGRGPLKPFKEADELKARCSAIFHQVLPEFGAYFDVMLNEGLLDLENRKNKAPGGYCTHFAAAKRPFIFMNAVGIHDDVQTLLHESGHAFHDFEVSRLPYYQQRAVGMEFAEVASMAMELLAGPCLSKARGGFYSETDTARALVDHLEKSILFWPYMAVVDAFQHWVYENPQEAEDPAKCDAAFAATWNRFITWIDWTGLEKELATGWQRKLHIHTVPFYYVEYGLAQLGAVQIWGNSLEGQRAAVEAYRHALSKGGTLPIPQLFATAGAKFALDAATLRAAAELMEKQIDSLTSGS